MEKYFIYDHHKESYTRTGVRASHKQHFYCISLKYNKDQIVRGVYGIPTEKSIHKN
jgi:hypothetical protein